MGVDNTTMICNEATELPSLIDTELLKSEHSTLPVERAAELASKCSTFSHDEQLKTFKEVGSRTLIPSLEIGTDPDYKFIFVWFIVLHAIGLSGALAGLLGFCQWKTSIYCKSSTI